MAAEPAPPGPPDDRWEAPEARVHHLEEWQTHVLPYEWTAMRNAVSFIHWGTDELRAQGRDTRDRVIRLAADLHEVRETQLIQGDAGRCSRHGQSSSARCWRRSCAASRRPSRATPGRSPQFPSRDAHGR
jgi:hypothetical protein